MKSSNLITLFLLVLYTLFIVSSAGRTTIRHHIHKQTGDVSVESEKIAHTNSNSFGCWKCWPHHPHHAGHLLR
ncbi:hypothetical protein QVD17_07834 [Tagetes erecta]|uniref:Transmembrane protein n=1 Tax=Tagetes erecta TaxID=13708 RepID=A0AAD8KY89_TARER|nr:hypothetical protein QVD17_07834 [Tagetes erecta]